MAKNTNIDRNAKIQEFQSQAGPFQAKIVSHIDETYMGALKVQLLKTTDTGNTDSVSTQILTARYLSPFGGQTPRFSITENDSYRHSQQSYGMWMVPPDVGTIVLVILVEGNPNECFWIGCVNDRYSNFAVPGNAASTRHTDATPDELNGTKLKGKKLPVAEYNKVIGDISHKGGEPTLFNKPYQKEFTETLIKQGLLEDETRGITSSSARREIPSTVFGISTPGPVDRTVGAPKGMVGADIKVNRHRSRLGGTSFVMDDGDDTLLRKNPATMAPPEYANIMQDEPNGNVTLPHNELVRLKTRTGHQILLHNTEDLIYIANANGTAWVELTADGKIDIYAKDSLSVHTENDFNLTAGRDITMEAGANISLKASGTYDLTNVLTPLKTVKGRIQIESAADTNMIVGGNHWVTTIGNYEAYTQGNNVLTAKLSTHIKSGGQHVETAPKIHMNGPAAQGAQIVTALSTHILPGHPTGNLTGTLVQRAPMHEPWMHHENLNPQNFKIIKTDRDGIVTVENKDELGKYNTPEAFKKVSKK